MSKLEELKDYTTWLTDISKRFESSQIKAASHINSTMLRFYWSLGKDIACRERIKQYGNNFYKDLSASLQQKLPDVKSFSVTNLHYMKWFYELYPHAENLPKAQVESNPANLPKAQVDLSLDGANKDSAAFLIPWGHNKLIIDKCKGQHDKALFFVHKTLQNNWSRAVLLNFLDTNLYERQGKAITNFAKLYPSGQSDLAQEMTKDPCNFDFLTLHKNYNEKELKDALMDSLQAFLLELGTGFAFLGREYRLEVGKTEQFIDMLFYNTLNHCYVVIELKVREFMPQDMGQLGTYVGIVDSLLKTKQDGPTIGLLICKTKDNVLAKYAVNAMNVPLGISEYDLSGVVPEKMQDFLPSIAEIEQQLQGK